MFRVAVAVSVLGAACGDPPSVIVDAPVADVAAVDPGSPLITAMPAQLDFPGVVVICPSAPQIVTVTNTGRTIAGPLTTRVVSSSAREFEIVADGCANQRLTPTARCMLGVRLAPAGAGGTKTATLEVAAPAVTTLVSLDGTVLTAGGLATNASIIDFGLVAPGATSTLHTFAVWTTTACASKPLHVPALHGTDPSQFAITSNECEGMVLAGGGMSCHIGVTYAPTTAGAHGAVLTIEEQLGETITVGLSGE